MSLCRWDSDGRGPVQLPELDLNFAVKRNAVQGTAKDQIDIVNVKEAAVWVPALLKELKLRVCLAQQLVVTGLATTFDFHGGVEPTSRSCRFSFLPHSDMRLRVELLKHLRAQVEDRALDGVDPGHLRC